MPWQRDGVAARLQREYQAGRLRFDRGQLAAAARLDALAAALERVRHAPAWRSWRLPGVRRGARAPRGVYLWGGVGRGKTRLMDMFYDTVGRPDRERDHFYLLMQSVHAELRAIGEHVNPLDLVAERIAAHSRLLCLDEFFVADIGDAMILSGLLDGLFRRGVTLVATSNQPPRELYADGLQRARFLPAIEMIAARMDVVHLDGAVDYRLLSFAGARTYFDSAAADSAGAMRRLFLALATSAPSGPVTIDAGGRPLAARDVAQGIAWFEFGELCATARGANDYLELAHRFHTIFVADVPVFSAADDDPARRFLTLIDALYDRRVNVVLSAAAAPQALYRGERLRFEFERASSRLIEMQSGIYLSTEHRA
ncbi:MAG TPA: cell division protein ZapE [Steroidobacteraceae bacterium]|nr:cell division protein ZapE [Steroidobacteraceae bacterium]